MDQPGNGNGVQEPQVPGGSSAMPAEFGTFYQAGYEAGYASGREAGYRQRCAEGSREARPHGTPKTEVASEAGTSAASNRRRGLLGLPCEHCAIFLYSDETQCPHCHIKVIRG